MTVDLRAFQALPAASAGSAIAATAATAATTATTATASAPAATMTPAMELALSSNFTSAARWRDEFIALVEAHANEPGRVKLAFAARDGSLLNRWVLPEAGSHASELLAMALPADDVAAAHAFVAGIDWAPVYQRYQDAVHAASEPFAAGQGDVRRAGELALLDVRRAGVFEAATAMLPGATWRDPARVADWAGALPAGRKVIVYCVYGHEVGRVTALRLRACGVQASFLDGGFDAWQRAGLRTVPKGETP